MDGFLQAVTIVGLSGVVAIILGIAAAIGLGLFAAIQFHKRVASPATKLISIGITRALKQAGERKQLRQHEAR